MPANTVVQETHHESGTELKNEETFARYGLPQFLYDGLTRLDYKQPTEIQARAIPVLMTGKDLLAQSATGSGKTAAFSIPILARVQRKSRDLQALIIVPTRELALQVTNVIKNLAGNAVRVTAIYGGVDIRGQTRGLLHGDYQVVVGTPGRLKDHLNRGNLRLDKLRFLVLDEADEMLDRGFAEDIEELIQATGTQQKRQTALFSATLPEWVKNITTKYLQQDHFSIMLEHSPESRPDITHLVYNIKMIDKPTALFHLLDTHDSDSILVFARTKIGVEKLAARLREAGYSAVGLQGNLTQRNRDEVMAAFRYKKVRIMVATNVGARGLDVHGISHVINYDVPESAELFTHRAGRTGRNGKSGTAITFLTGEDRGKWREIEAHLNSKGVEFHQKAWDGPRSQPEFNSHSRPAKNSFDFPPKDKNTNREHPNYSRKKSQDRPEKPWYL